jgi:hypothetical protein
MGLDKAQRRAASRALLPGGAVAPEHRLTTVQVARHLGAYGWALWIFLTVGLANGALFLGAESPTDRLWAAAALIGFGLAAVHGCALRKARAIVVDEFGG